MFDGMSRVKKQQAIYAPLMDKIATNEIHALSIRRPIPTPSGNASVNSSCPS